MTKFEMIGVGLQNDSNSLSQANKRFASSCNICCSRGIRIECDSCAIRVAHEQVVADINDLREAERKDIASALNQGFKGLVLG